MVAPTKPWEMPMGRSYTDFLPNTGLHSNSGAPGLVVGLGPGVARGAPVAPPPLPSRSGRSRHHSGISNLSHHFNAGFPGYGYYPGYPSYNHMLPRRDDFESRFVQMAEETSAPALHSIETFVRSISSVSMMLESTYQAMHMSFRAVLSVADNMSRLRGIIAQFLSSVTVLKAIHWFYRKILYLIGLRGENPLREELWRAAEAKAKGSPANQTSAWPLLAFFSLIFGGPYLMYKLAGAPSSADSSKSGEWVPAEHGGTPCVGIYDFDSSVPGELSFSKGDALLLAKEPFAKRQGGWILAAKGNTTGLVPANRIAYTKPAKEPGVHSYPPRVYTTDVQVSNPEGVAAKRAPQVWSPSTGPSTSRVGGPQPNPAPQRAFGPQPHTVAPQTNAVPQLTPAPQPNAAPQLAPVPQSNPTPQADATPQCAAKPPLDPTSEPNVDADPVAVHKDPEL